MIPLAVLVLSTAPLRSLDPIYHTPALLIPCAPAAVAYVVTCVHGSGQASVGVAAPSCANVGNVHLVSIPVASSACQNQVAIRDLVGLGPPKAEANVRCDLVGGSGCPCELFPHTVACSSALARSPQRETPKTRVRATRAGGTRPAQHRLRPAHGGRVKSAPAK